MNEKIKLRAKQLGGYIGRRIQFCRGAGKQTVFIGVGEAEAIEAILKELGQGAQAGNRGLVAPPIRESGA